MPFLDADLILAWEFSVAHAGSTGTQYATQYELDFETIVLPTTVSAGATAAGLLTSAYPDKGMGSPLVVRFIITTAIATSNAATIAFCLCFDSTVQTGTNQGATSTATIAVQTGPITVSAANTGVGCYIPELKIPDMHLRYMTVNVIVVNTTSAGNVTAFIDAGTGMRHR
jgi:hypothetical protein